MLDKLTTELTSSHPFGSLSSFHMLKGVYVWMFLTVYGAVNAHVGTFMLRREFGVSHLPPAFFHLTLLRQGFSVKPRACRYGYPH